MSVLSLKAESTVSLYGEYINTVINPIVRTIANAAHLFGNTVVERSLGGNSTTPKRTNTTSRSFEQQTRD